MADVSHELGSIRHIVGSPLSSKVAMFNKVADQHNASQLLNPFSNVRGSSPARPTFSKDEYGKPLAGSLTEMRGQKANIHVCKEMLELCEIICQEGFAHPENKDIKVIFFGDLFNIYNHINDKCVGLLLRARKHKLVDFEGEMLFQRRDDEVPIVTTKPIAEIRKYIHNKTEEFRRSVSPAPRATSVIIDNMRRAVSQTPTTSPSTSKAGTPRSLSPQPNAKITTEKVPVQHIAKLEPTLRQAQSTPAINIVGIENPTTTENSTIETPESKSEKKDIKNNNKDENNTEAGTSPKVTVYLTKAPVVETNIIVEENEETETKKEDNIPNPEIKVDIPNKENEEQNVSESNKLPEENKEIKNEISNNESNQENKENIVVASEISNNNVTPEVQSDTVKTESQPVIETTNEIQNNSEEKHEQITPVENNTSAENANLQIIVTEPTSNTESTTSSEAVEKTTEDAAVTGKPPTGIVHNDNNEVIKSPEESTPIEQPPNNNNSQ